MKLLRHNSIWLMFILLVFAGQLNAQNKTFDPAVLSAEAHGAYQELLNINLFAIGGVGYSGTTSEGEQSLITLLSDAKAVDALKGLVTIATPEGGLYALLGLRFLGCDCLASEAKRFLDRPPAKERSDPGEGDLIVDADHVKRMSGCLVFTQKRSDAAGDIVSGKYDPRIEYIKKLARQKANKQR